MNWIIDLLVEKWNKAEKTEDFKPIPLYIEDELVPLEEKQEENSKKNVIIIEL